MFWKITFPGAKGKPKDDLIPACQLPSYLHHILQYGQIQQLQLTVGSLHSHGTLRLKVSLSRVICLECSFFMSSLLFLLQAPTPVWTFLRKFSLSSSWMWNLPTWLSPYPILTAMVVLITLIICSLSIWRETPAGQETCFSHRCHRILTPWLIQLNKWQRRTGSTIIEGSDLVISEGWVQAKVQNHRRKRPFHRFGI